MDFKIFIKDIIYNINIKKTTVLSRDAQEFQINILDSSKRDKGNS